MWPFGDKLKDQNAMEKYRRWLRRWLLGSWQYVAAGTIVAAILVGLVWASLNTWNKEDAEPATGDKPATEIISGYSPAAENTLTGPLKDEQIEQRKQELIGSDKEDTGSTGTTEEKETPAPTTKPGDAGEMAFSMPVNGEMVSSFGYHYSPLFDDYRFHTGVALLAEENGQVRPCLPGKVINVTGNTKEGYTVKMDHGNGWSSSYEKLSSTRVESGDTLAANDPLGQAEIGKEITFTLYKDGEAVDPASYLQKF